jgi:hypothetical protein
MAAFPPEGYPLDKETTKYNRGYVLPRIRNRRRGTKFRLRRPTPVHDGSGRELAISPRSVKLNAGAVKQMDVDGQGLDTYLFAQKTGAGVSGWVRRTAIRRPPRVPRDNRNPKPPAESETPLVIDGATAREKLRGLRFLGRYGLPRGPGANQAVHYAGRNLDQHGYVYLLWSAPNVVWGGIAKDSLPEGSEFVPALDENGNPIEEITPMYRRRDFLLRHKEDVTFLYGRAPESATYGWIIRANVGEV